MRLYLGPPPLVPEFQPEETGWKRLREPSPIWLQLTAIPVAISTAALFVWMWGQLATYYQFELSGYSVTVRGDSYGPTKVLIVFAPLLGMAFGAVALVAVHELLHGMVCPGGLSSPKTLLGVWPAKLLFYAAYLGPMSRDRFLCVFACPFVVLSVFPLLLAPLLPAGQIVLAAVSIVNAAFACGDLVGMAMLLWQVPRAALVQNQGWQTWWIVAPMTADGTVKPLPDVEKVEAEQPSPSERRTSN